VLTIDPARRLAQSLGLTELDNDPRPVLGVDGTGTLDAMMLDMKRTFDAFVESNADAERAETIIANPFYQSLSSPFAGTQEHMAMEQLASCGPGPRPRAGGTGSSSTPRRRDRP
jgi:anion-transporting  ArsA/GET3 family ATPase